MRQCSSATRKRAAARSAGRSRKRLCVKE
ncbi:hypothetical protein C3E97_027755 [Pseudomonas sp. MWU12-2115]|nr:hypothetical protein C3E97_027755 [Pseudomonas sp. MWU12-2115]